MSPPIGPTLTAYRERRGFTLRGFAARAGIPPSTVCRYESGKLVPGWRELNQLADALGIKASTLVRAAEDDGLRFLTLEEDDGK